MRGVPDHGAAWTRVWRRVVDEHVVDCDEFVLRRRLDVRDRVVAWYRLEARPGFRFVWAAHALPDVSPSARLVLPDGTPTRIYPDLSASYVDDRWPTTLRIDRLGPDDGTAMGAIVRAAAVEVVDGHRLAMRLYASAPTSIALWRNLRGFPAGAPYRSIGVEPTLGSVVDLAAACPGDAVTVPADGSVEWRLDVSASWPCHNGRSAGGHMPSCRRG